MKMTTRWLSGLHKIFLLKMGCETKVISFIALHHRDRVKSFYSSFECTLNEFAGVESSSNKFLRNKSHKKFPSPNGCMENFHPIHSRRGS
jgi:hypothetical protein